jgi:outer membrane lipoprotein-sorting protein
VDRPPVLFRTRDPLAEADGMNLNTSRPVACLAAALLLAGPFTSRAAAPRPETPRLEQFAAAGLADLQARVRVEKADQAELAKINRDFGMAYRLKDLTLRYKEPNKLRMEGPIGMMIVNGPARLFRVPQLRLTKKDELGDTPGKRYTLLDVGVLTASGLQSASCKFLRAETTDGVSASVFEVTFPGDASNRYNVWVDTARRLVLQREWQDGSGKRRAHFRYLEPKEVHPGVWFPSRIEIRNVDDAVAGVTVYSDVKVNQGMEDSLFTIS